MSAAVELQLQRDFAVPAWKQFLLRFSRQKIGVAALVYLVVITLAAVFSPVIGRYDPAAQDLMNALSGPTWAHWLGTDSFGRDNWARLIDATRLSLMAPLLAVGIAIVIGVPAGLVAGYFGSTVDWVISRLIETLMSLPSLILVVCLIGALGPGFVNAMIALGIVYAPRLARVVRSATLAVAEETFIEASRSIGVGTGRILAMHVLPNILSPVIVQISLMMGLAILTEAGLSYIGLGAQPPTASWGVMIRQGFEYIYDSSFNMVPPGLMIAFTVLAFNFLGDAIRDSFGQDLGRPT